MALERHAMVYEPIEAGDYCSSCEPDNTPVSQAPLRRPGPRGPQLSVQAVVLPV